MKQLIKKINGDFTKELPVFFCCKFKNVQISTITSERSFQTISYAEFILDFQNPEVNGLSSDWLNFFFENDDEKKYFEQESFYLFAQTYGEEVMYLQNIDPTSNIAGGGTLRKENGQYILSIQKLFHENVNDYVHQFAVINIKSPEPHNVIGNKEPVIFTNGEFEKNNWCTKVDVTEMPGVNINSNTIFLMNGQGSVMPNTNKVIMIKECPMQTIGYGILDDFAIIRVFGWCETLAEKENNINANQTQNIVEPQVTQTTANANIGSNEAYQIVKGIVLTFLVLVFISICFSDPLLAIVLALCIIVAAKCKQ